MTAGAEAGVESTKTRIPARMDRLPWSSWHWLVVIGLGTVWVLDGLEVTIVGAISAVLQKSATLGLSATEVGLAGTIYIAGAASGALVLGYMTDHFGRKRLFMVTLGIYLVATVFTAFSPTFLWFGIGRFFTGFGIGGEYAAINSAIDELIPARARGWTDLAINGSFWIGAAGGAALSIILLDPSIFPTDLGWRLSFGLGALLGIGILLVRRYVPESPRWLMTHGRMEEAESLVGEIEEEVKERTGRGHLSEPDEEIEVVQRGPTGFGAIARTLFSKYPRRSLLGFTLMGTQAFLYNAVLFTFAIVLTTFFGVGETSAGVYLVPFGIANFLGALTLGRFFDTVGRRPMICATFVAAAAIFAVDAVLFQADTVSTGVFVTLLCASFFFASAAASSAYLTVSEVFPLETRAMAIAFFYAVATGIGGATGPLLFGSLIGTGDRGSLFIGYLIAAGLMVVAAIAELFLGVSAEQESLEDVAEPLAAEKAREEAPDEARPSRPSTAILGGRSGSMWSPYPLASAPGQERDLEREVDEIVRLLRERGPMTRAQLARELQSRYWGPRRLARALSAARRAGGVHRVDRSSFAATP
jgi:MFS family permease